MREAIVFEAKRSGYGIDQLLEGYSWDMPVTVGALREFLEDYDEDTLFILSHDKGYTYGSIDINECFDAREDEAGDWTVDRY